MPSNAPPHQPSKDDSSKAPTNASETSTPTPYRAPYYAHPPSNVPGVYMIMFHPGHTLAQHFAFLDRGRFAVTALDDGYFATLTDDLFDAVRTDPGVQFIEDDVSGERCG